MELFQMNHQIYWHEVISLLDSETITMDIYEQELLNCVLITKLVTYHG